MRNVKTTLPFFITITLFFIPFFWLHPGELDLGGDSSRLYFYDPVSYLLNTTLYGVAASVFGFENIYFFGAPFFVALSFLRYFFSPTIVISLFHGINLSLAFLFCYLTVKELITHEENSTFHTLIPSLLAGLLYALSPAILDGWQYVLLSRNQVFLNPLLFYLLFKYFKSSKLTYLLCALITSFIFSPNFSVIAAPALLSFYPISILFLVLYTKLILKKSIQVSHVVFAFFGFLLLQSFHLLPQVINILSPNSIINSTIFSDAGKYDRGLSFFTATAANIKVTTNLLGLPQLAERSYFSWLFMILPFIIVASFIYNKKKTLLLLTSIFLITLYFETANITGIGLEIYKKLFILPGFAMFRNYYGQWQFTYLFFYAVLFGFSFSIIKSNIQKKYTYFLAAFIFLVLVFNAFPFIKGDILHRPLWQSNNVSSTFIMDPAYEELLAYIHTLSGDGKILTLPLSDYSYQLIGGKNGGAYEGPSSIAYLGGKKDFSGYEEFMNYKNTFLDLIKTRDYEKFKKLLGFLGIKYIFYNADPGIYDEFSGFPYFHVKDFVPKTQKEYKKFITDLQLKQDKNVRNKFFIYELSDRYTIPPIYIAKKKVLLRASEDDIKKTLAINTPSEKVGSYISLKDDTWPKISYDEMYLTIPNNSSYLDVFKNADDSRLPWAFVSQKLSSFTYPFVVWREQKSIKNAPFDDAYIDRNILFADKRMNELLNFSSEVKLLGNIHDLNKFASSWKEPTITEALLSEKYNYWEVSFIRYQKILFNLIDVVSKPNHSQYSEISNKALIRRVLASHKQKAFDAIKTNSAFSDEKKQYLVGLAIALFDGIEKKLDFRLPKTEINTYSLKDISSGMYDIYLQKDQIPNPQKYPVELTIQNQASPIKNFSEEKIWYIAQNVFLDEKKDRTISLYIPSQENLLEKSQLNTQEREKLENDEKKLTSENFTFSNGLIWLISDIQPNTLYKLSFNYITGGKEFVMNWYNADKEKKRNNTSNLTNKLESSTWKSYEVLFRTDELASSGFLQITKEEKDKSVDSLSKEIPFYQIELKDLSLVQVPSPEIVLRKHTDIKNVPTIKYTRENPTRYILHISNVQEPYMLVFGEAFNSNWKLVDPNSDKPTLQGKLARFFAKMYTYIVINIFENNLVKGFTNNIFTEEKTNNIFWNEKTLDTWGKNTVASNKHFVGNGYANAWYISPADINNKKDYTLILELSTQNLFYIALIPALLTFIVTLLGLIFLLFKRRK